VPFEEITANVGVGMRPPFFCRVIAPNEAWNHDTAGIRYGSYLVPNLILLLKTEALGLFLLEKTQRCGT
jgi:hypothetical protein